MEIRQVPQAVVQHSNRGRVWKEKIVIATYLTPGGTQAFTEIARVAGDAAIRRMYGSVKPQSVMPITRPAFVGRNLRRPCEILFKLTLSIRSDDCCGTREINGDCEIQEKRATKMAGSAWRALT